jgi:hypothetical protein
VERVAKSCPAKPPNKTRHPGANDGRFPNVRLPVILLLLLPLGGCIPAEKHDLAQCVAQATKATPVDGLGDADERHDAIGETVVDCMRRGGYQHNLADPGCIDDVDFDSHCYMPTGFWRKAAYTFESKS